MIFFFNSIESTAEPVNWLIWELNSKCDVLLEEELDNDVQYEDNDE